MAFKKGHVHFAKGTKGVMKKNSGSFKKGFVPWNKGTHGKMNIWNKGKKLPQELIKKLSKAHLGYKMPDSQRMNISKALKGKYTGKQCSAWNGGSSFLPYSPSFNRQTKERVRVRDNFVCQECGIPELELSQNLDPHHIDYDKQNSSLENLISLCRSCHMKTNRNREYWKRHFKEKLACQIMQIV